MKNIIFLCTFLFSLTLLTAQNPDDKIKFNYNEQGQYEILVQFPMEQTFEGLAPNLSKEEKGRLVYQALTAQASATQEEAKEYLLEKGITYEVFTLSNSLHCKVPGDILPTIAKLNNVLKILPNPAMKQDLGTVEDKAIPHNRAELSWGIKDLGVQELWDNGHKGQGISIAGADTGYEWEHPALKGGYRGSENNHDYAWHDGITEDQDGNEGNPCGYAVDAPCDDHSHGTHTAGTFAGREDTAAAFIFGMAPEAEWIGCRNMESGFGTPASYLSCMEWFLAPTTIEGEDPRPDMAPDIINNSWGCIPEEGCTEDMLDVLQYANDNLKAAGILVVASAGNDGREGCETVRNPIAIYESSFTVGAYDLNHNITGFSSRGPVTVDTSFRMKPNIVAPGSFVYSSVLDGEYGFSSGTSMSGPHIAGLAALVLSAKPELRGQVDSLITYIQENSQSLGVENTCSDLTYPNNVEGWGRPEIDIPNSSVGETKSKTLDFSIYPNPTQGSFSLQFSGVQENNEVQITVRRMDGTTLMEEERHLSGSGQILHMPTSPNAMYLLTVQGRDFSMSKPLILIHR